MTPAQRPLRPEDHDLQAVAVIESLPTTLRWYLPGARGSTTAVIPGVRTEGNEIR